MNDIVTIVKLPMSIREFLNLICCIEHSDKLVLRRQDWLNVVGMGKDHTISLHLVDCCFGDAKSSSNFWIV